MWQNNCYDFRKNLRFTSRVISKVGSKINVGEKFTLRFTASNTALNFLYLPKIIYNNVKVYIDGTTYAKPVNNERWYTLPDSSLHPGESSFIDVEFEAINDIWGYRDNYEIEKVAIAKIYADLDVEAFFKIEKKLTVYEEIEET